MQVLQPGLIGQSAVVRLPKLCTAAEASASLQEQLSECLPAPHTVVLLHAEGTVTSPGGPSVKVLEGQVDFTQYGVNQDGRTAALLACWLPAVRCMDAGKGVA